MTDSTQEEKVQELAMMGFDAGLARAALVKAHNRMEAAVGFLVDGSSLTPIHEPLPDTGGHTSPPMTVSRSSSPETAHKVSPIGGVGSATEMREFRDTADAVIGPQDDAAPVYGPSLPPAYTEHPTAASTTATATAPGMHGPTTTAGGGGVTGASNMQPSASSTSMAAAAGVASHQTTTGATATGAAVSNAAGPSASSSAHTSAPPSSPSATAATAAGPHASVGAALKPSASMTNLPLVPVKEEDVQVEEVVDLDLTDQDRARLDVPIESVEHVFLERNTAANKPGNEALFAFLRDNEDGTWAFPGDPFAFVENTLAAAVDLPLKRNEPLAVCMQCAIKAACTGRLAQDELAQRFVTSIFPAVFDKLLHSTGSYFTRSTYDQVFDLCRIGLRLCVALLPHDHRPACQALEKILDSRSTFATYTQNYEERELNWTAVAFEEYVRPTTQSRFYRLAWMIQLTNEFFNLGGFTQVYACLQQPALTLTTAYELMKPFSSHLAGELTPAGNTHVRPIFKHILTFLNGMDLKKLGATEYNQVSCLLEVIAKLAEHDLKEEAVTFRFTMAGALLEMDTFNGRMNALKEIDSLCTDTQRYFSGRVDSDRVLRWLADHNVLRRALKGNLHHQQYVERLQDIVGFMCRARPASVTADDLTDIWRAQIGQHGTVVQNVQGLLTRIAWYLPADLLCHLLDCFKQAWRDARGDVREMESLLEFIYKLASEDRHRNMAAQAMALLWEFYTEPNAPESVRTRAMEMHVKTLTTYNSTAQERMDWLLKIVDNIAARKHLMQSLKFFQTICTQTQASYYHSFSSQLMNLHSKRDFCELLAHSLHQCWSKAITYVRQHPDEDPDTLLHENLDLFDGCRYADLLQEYLATLNKYLRAGQRWLNTSTFSHLWKFLIAEPSCSADLHIYGAWLKENVETEVQPRAQQSVFLNQALQLPVERFTPDIFDALVSLFLCTNGEHNRIYGSKLESMRVEQSNLLGLSRIWTIALETRDAGVAEKALGVLERVYNDAIFSNMPDSGPHLLFVIVRQRIASLARRLDAFTEGTRIEDMVPAFAAPAEEDARHSSSPAALQRDQHSLEQHAAADTSGVDIDGARSGNTVSSATTANNGNNGDGGGNEPRLARVSVTVEDLDVGHVAVVVEAPQQQQQQPQHHQQQQQRRERAATSDKMTADCARGQASVAMDDGADADDEDEDDDELVVETSGVSSAANTGAATTTATAATPSSAAASSHGGGDSGAWYTRPHPKKHAKSSHTLHDDDDDDDNDDDGHVIDDDDEYVGGDGDVDLEAGLSRRQHQRKRRGGISPVDAHGDLAGLSRGTFAPIRQPAPTHVVDDDEVEPFLQDWPTEHDDDSGNGNGGGAGDHGHHRNRMDSASSADGGATTAGAAGTTMATNTGTIGAASASASTAATATGVSGNKRNSAAAAAAASTADDLAEQISEEVSVADMSLPMVLQQLERLTFLFRKFLQNDDHSQIRSIRLVRPHRVAARGDEIVFHIKHGGTTASLRTHTTAPVCILRRQVSHWLNWPYTSVRLTINDRIVNLAKDSKLWCDIGVTGGSRQVRVTKINPNSQSNVSQLPGNDCQGFTRPLSNNVSIEDELKLVSVYASRDRDFMDVLMYLLVALPKHAQWVVQGDFDEAVYSAATKAQETLDGLLQVLPTNAFFLQSLAQAVADDCEDDSNSKLPMLFLHAHRDQHLLAYRVAALRAAITPGIVGTEGAMLSTQALRNRFLEVGGFDVICHLLALAWQPAPLSPPAEQLCTELLLLILHTLACAFDCTLPELEDLLREKTMLVEDSLDEAVFTNGYTRSPTERAYNAVKHSNELQLLVQQCGQFVSRMHFSAESAGSLVPLAYRTVALVLCVRPSLLYSLGTPRDVDRFFVQGTLYDPSPLCRLAAARTVCQIAQVTVEYTTLAVLRVQTQEMQDDEEEQEQEQANKAAADTPNQQRLQQRQQQRRRKRASLAHVPTSTVRDHNIRPDAGTSLLVIFVRMFLDRSLPLWSPECVKLPKPPQRVFFLDQVFDVLAFLLNTLASVDSMLTLQDKEVLASMPDAPALTTMEMALFRKVALAHYETEMHRPSRRVSQRSSSSSSLSSSSSSSSPCSPEKHDAGMANNTNTDNTGNDSGGDGDGRNNPFSDDDTAEAAKQAHLLDAMSTAVRQGSATLNPNPNTSDGTHAAGGTSSTEHEEGDNGDVDRAGDTAARQFAEEKRASVYSWQQQQEEAAEEDLKRSMRHRRRRHRRRQQRRRDKGEAACTMMSTTSTGRPSRHSGGRRPRRLRLASHRYSHAGLYEENAASQHEQRAIHGHLKVMHELMAFRNVDLLSFLRPQQQQQQQQLNGQDQYVHQDDDDAFAPHPQELQQSLQQKGEKEGVLPGTSSTASSAATPAGRSSSSGGDAAVSRVASEEAVAGAINTFGHGLSRQGSAASDGALPSSAHTPKANGTAHMAAAPTPAARGAGSAQQHKTALLSPSTAAAATVGGAGSNDSSSCAGASGASQVARMHLESINTGSFLVILLEFYLFPAAVAQAMAEVTGSSEALQQPLCQLDFTRNLCASFVTRLCSRSGACQEVVVEWLDRFVLSGVKIGATEWKVEPNIEPRTCGVGLANASATCYMNSTFQSLFMQPIVREFVLSIDDALETKYRQERLKEAMEEYTQELKKKKQQQEQQQHETVSGDAGAQQEQQQQQQQQQETGTEQGEDKGYQSQSAAGRATADTGANAVQQQQQQQQQHDADEEATADAGDVSEPTPQIVEDDATAPPAPPARRTVTVAKNERGLGMKFLGLGQGLGVIVTALMPDTPAHACPDLNIYDTICKINGTDVLDLEHDAVRDILVSGSSFELEVLPAPAAKVAILVRESKDDPLGVAVVDDDHHRVRVANVSEAARFADAQLEPGEEIVSVNHRDVRTMSAMQVGVFMRTASDVLVIAANPCADPLPEHETTA